MKIRSFIYVPIAAAAFLPYGAHAQFTADPYHSIALFGPNLLGFTPGLRVSLGATSGPNGLQGTATRDGTESCDGPLSLPLDNLGNLGVPQQANGSYFPSSVSRICTGAWQLALNVNGSPLVGAPPSTPNLVGAQLLPFVTSATLTSSNDGKEHTFQWPAVPPGSDVLAVVIWDRSALPPQLLSYQSFHPTTTSFVINVGSSGLYYNDRPYTLDVRNIAERDDAFPSGRFVKALSRTQTFFDFVLPSTPLTTAPVPLSSGGAVTTPNEGAATSDQPSAASISVPEAALVSVTTTRDPQQDSDVPQDSLAFWKISIPDPANPSSPLYFGVGTHWYDCYEKKGGDQDDEDDDDDQGERKSKGNDRDNDRKKYTGDGSKYDKDRYRPIGACNLIVNRLRIDKSKIGSGRGTMPDANLILKQKLYYKPDAPTERAPEDPPAYKQLYSCRITSGPYPGEPCVLYAKVYNKSSLPTNVANPQEYLGDYEALILTNENGRIYLR
jgi:hypothetical protein